MMKLEFDPEKHEYRLEGELVPSVTELLKPITDKGYANINPAVLQEAARRGTEVHGACESIDYGLDVEDVGTDIIPYLDAYTAFLRDYKPEWLGIEDMVYGSFSAWWGSLDYAGTIDRWGMIDGKLAVLDIKTVASPSVRQKICTALQTILYSRALTICGKSEKTPEMRYALYLKKDGTYNLVDLDDFVKSKDVPTGGIIETLTAIYSFGEELEEMLDTKKEKNNE